MKRSVFMVLACLILVGPSQASAADEVKITPPSDAKSDRVISVPYGFYSDSFGLAAAYVYSVVGSPQPQAAWMATGMIGTKGSAMLFLMGRDIRVFGVERLFMDPIVSTGYFVDNNAYIRGNPRYFYERPGSNESNQNDYI